MLDSQKARQQLECSEVPFPVSMVLLRNTVEKYINTVEKYRNTVEKYRHVPFSLPKVALSDA